MSRSRTLLALLLAFGLIAALGPAMALANGGSAGDNQYVDPLAGVHSHGSTSSSSSGTTPAAPLSNSAVSATTTTAPSPTATSAATTTGASGKSAKALPFTGFDLWPAAGIGAVLLAGGLILRRRQAT